MDNAAALPYANPLQLTLVSQRTGNYQFNSYSISSGCAEGLPVTGKAMTGAFGRADYNY